MIKHKRISDDGLEVYLQGTQSKHRGLGYKVFAILVEAEVNVSNLARAFKVARATIERWRDIYKEEQAKADKELELDSK